MPRPRHAAVRLLLAALTTATLLLTHATSAHAVPEPQEDLGHRAMKTVYFDMFRAQHVKPKRIFLTANSGPYLKKLAWSGWGSTETVATGKYISDCASCPGPEKRDAWVTMKKRVTCERRGVRTYRKIVVVLSEPDEGGDTTRFTIPGGCP